MGTITAGEIITQASEIAEDESNVTWTSAQGLAWVNDAQLMITAIRPDTYVTRQSMQLAPGTVQAIAGNRLYTIIRNMGSDGQTPGRAIRLVDRGIKDEFEPDWHADTESTVVYEYIYDDRTPDIFYVSPPVHATTPVWVETVEGVTPPALVATTDTIYLNDTYKPAMVEWVCYRFFQRDAEEVDDQNRSRAHFQNFQTMMGAKLESDILASPKQRAHLA